MTKRVVLKQYINSSSEMYNEIESYINMANYIREKAIENFIDIAFEFKKYDTIKWIPVVKQKMIDNFIVNVSKRILLKDSGLIASKLPNKKYLKSIVSEIIKDIFYNNKLQTVDLDGNKFEYIKSTDIKVKEDIFNKLYLGYHDFKQINPNLIELKTFVDSDTRFIRLPHHKGKLFVNIINFVKDDKGIYIEYICYDRTVE